MSTITRQRYVRDAKLVFGYFRIYSIGLLIPKDVIEMVVKFVHIAMKWETYASDINVTESMIELPKDHRRHWRLIYSLPIMPIGYHQWKVKVVNNPSNIYIGITSKNDRIEGGIWSYRHCYWYIWGNEDSMNGRWETHLKEITVPNNYQSGDVISVVIEDNQLSFSKNDEPSWKTIEIKTQDGIEYYLAVHAYAPCTKLEMLSYSDYKRKL